MNSPQSQKLAVGSMVERYVKAATRKIIHPVMTFSFLKFIGVAGFDKRRMYRKSQAINFSCLRIVELSKFAALSG